LLILSLLAIQSLLKQKSKLPFWKIQTEKTRKILINKLVTKPIRHLIDKGMYYLVYSAYK